jgi:hypothetical protein
MIFIFETECCSVQVFVFKCFLKLSYQPIILCMSYTIDKKKYESASKGQVKIKLFLSKMEWIVGPLGLSHHNERSVVPVWLLLTK